MTKDKEPNKTRKDTNTNQPASLGERRARNKKKRIRAILIGSVLLLILAVVVFYSVGGYEWFLLRMGWKDVSVEPSGVFLEYIPTGAYKVAAIGNTILVCDENGVTGLDRDGKWKWQTSFEFRAPTLVANSDYVLLSDVGGTGVYAFGEDGLLWKEIYPDGVIGAFAAAGNQKITVIHQASSYKSAATLLDWKQDNRAVFSRKFGSYYMLTGSVSMDGSQMAVSGVYSESGRSSGAVVFLRTSDGEVFATEEYDGMVYPLAYYLKDNVLYLANSDSVRRVVKASTASSSKDADRVIWDRNAQTTKLLCAATLDDTYFVAVFGEGDEEWSTLSSVSTVCLYDGSGREQRSFQVEGKVLGIRTQKDTIALFTDHVIFVYNGAGQLIGSYDGLSDLESIDFLGTRVLVASGSGRIARVSFR